MAKKIDIKKLIESLYQLLITLFLKANDGDDVRKDYLLSRKLAETIINNTNKKEIKTKLRLLIEYIDKEDLRNISRISEDIEKLKEIV